MVLVKTKWYWFFVQKFKNIFLQKWIDEKLKWESNKYGGLKSIQFIHGETWRPELVLYK